MNVNDLIKTTLTPLGINVSFATATNEADTYVVFVEYNQAPWLSADDEEMYTKHFYQVDIFSTGNYLQLVKDVKREMKNVGFTRMFESETYDEDAKKFRKIIRFNYISKN